MIESIGMKNKEKKKTYLNKNAQSSRFVGINGFGRIGRAIFRILLERNNYDCIVINDINPDINHIAYQLKYDSLYGTLKNDVQVEGACILIDGEKRVFVYNMKDIDAVPWKKHKVSYIVESSGIHRNIIRARRLLGIVEKVIVTNSPLERHVDRTVIMGVNEGDIDMKKDFLISSSICDALAIGQALNLLDKNYEIENGFVTTLHPWLSHQNLLDGPSPIISYPGYKNTHYAGGRASPTSLLPKPTTAVSAVNKVLPNLKGKLRCFSYRVPTGTVSSSDISLHVKKETAEEELNNLFENAAQNQKYPNISVNYEHLVSIDFRGSEYSAIVDGRWTMVQGGTFIKMVLWYDNEWGYGSSVVNLIDFLSSR